MVNVKCQRNAKRVSVGKEDGELEMLPSFDISMMSHWSFNHIL